MGNFRKEKRSQGNQTKRYKDSLEASLKDFNIPTDSREQDQTKWRCLIGKGAAQYEAKRICEAEELESAKNAKKKPMDQIRVYALFVTDSLELKLA